MFKAAREGQINLLILRYLFFMNILSNKRIQDEAK